MKTFQKIVHVTFLAIELCICPLSLNIKTCTGRPMIMVVFLSQLKRADFMLTEKRTCIINSANVSSSSGVSLMLSVSSNCSARSRNDGSILKRSPSSNHFWAEDKRPSLVHDKPFCFSNKRVCVSSNQCGVGCVRLDGGGFGGTKAPEDAIGCSAGEYKRTTHDC